MKLGLIAPSFPVYSLRKDEELRGRFLSDTMADANAAFEELKQAIRTRMALGHDHEYFSNFLSVALPLIAGLTPKEFDIKIIDENREDVDFDEAFDVVGITAITQQATKAYQIADEFRRRGVYVVIGGIHATVLPEEAKAHADTVIVGEAEKIWPQFVADFIQEKAQPFYRENGVVDMTQSPVPRFDLLQGKGYKSIVVQATRGCPHDCEFCASSKIYGVRYRHKTVEQVVEEIQFIKNIWERPFISFADDNMFVHRKFSKELLRALIPLDIRWSAFSDTAVAEDDELLELIRESGGVSLLIGFESVSEESLGSIGQWKQRQLKNYPKAVERIQSHGIVIQGTFIVGFDSDELSVFENIRRFLLENHVYIFNIGMLTPFPGTRLRERLAQEGRLLDTDWDNHNFFGVNFMPKQIPPAELQKNLLETFRELLYDPEFQRRKISYFRGIYRDLYRSGRSFKTL